MCNPNFFPITRVTAKSRLRFPAAQASRCFSSLRSAPLLVLPSEIRATVLSGEVVPVDSSWFMPNAPRKSREEFLGKRIPGARFLDLDEVASSHELGLKHMMPTERVFADSCEKLGIRPSSHVVIYDSQGIFSSPRGLFMFRAFGHEKSSVLDGGLPGWEAEGLPLDSTVSPNHETVTYPTPALNRAVIRDYQQITDNASSEKENRELLLDARSHGRYAGDEPEPRPGLSSGHIPYSSSLPFGAFLKINTFPDNSVQYTTMLSPLDLKSALVQHLGVEQAESVIKGERAIVTTCGSGMTAAILWLGLNILGVGKVALYDESWTGYASRPSSKIQKSQPLSPT